MTIQTPFLPLVNAGNGVTTQFAVTWPFANLSDVVVQLLVVATGAPQSPAPVLNGLGTYDYTISSTPDPDTGISQTGTIIFNTAPPATLNVWRGRASSDLQGKSLPTNGRLPAKSIEGALDLRTLTSQERSWQQSYALSIPYYENFNMTLPSAAARANKYLYFNADGSLGVAAALAGTQTMIGLGTVEVWTSAYASLALADAAAAGLGGLLVVDQAITLAANTSLASKAVRFAGGKITTGAFTLSINAIFAPEVAIFDKAGAGAITINNTALPSLLGWFAPTADGATDDTNPVKRWIASSLNRRTGLVATILTDTAPVSTGVNVASVFEGAGLGATNFKSKTGADIFQFPGVNISGLNYVTYARVGGFTCIGQGSGVGSGYGIVISSNGTGYNNYFHDIDSTAMGGGTIKDTVGLFSTEFANMRGGESGLHVFDMNGSGPASFMTNPYARNALALQAGYRIHNSNLVLVHPNGLNVGSAAKSFWGIFGDSTAAITTGAITGGGSMTIPADAGNAIGIFKIIGGNVEAIPDIGILVKNGTVDLDSNTVFQTNNAAANFVALYIADSLGTGIQGRIARAGNFALGTGGAAWAQGCPVWVPSSQCYFHEIGGDFTHQSLSIRDYGDVVTLTAAAGWHKYLGSIGAGFVEAKAHDGLYCRVLSHGASGYAGFYGATPIVQQARAGQLTDSTGGAASGTLAAIAAGAAYAQADMVAAKNAIASLAAKVNALETIIHNLGLSA